MKRTILAILLGLFASAFALGQKVPDQPAKLTSDDYASLLSKLKGGDTSISFKDLRIAFSATKGYSFSGPDREARNKFYKPFGEKNYKDALKEAEKYLDSVYVDANAHFVAHVSAKELKDEKKADFHKAVLIGLIDSIRDGNDGLTAKTPFMVISIDEEYTLMRFLGLRHSSQSLQHSDGHTYDVFDAVDAETNQARKVYFNIDIVWDAETKLFSK